MIKSLLTFNRATTPIGIDIGSRSLKLIQLCNERRRVIESSRWDWDGLSNPFVEQGVNDALVVAVRNALTGRNFQGTDVIASISSSQIFLQNLRVPQGSEEELKVSIQREAAGRIPYPLEETEIRFWDCAEVRQGDTTMREVLVFACHRPKMMSIPHSLVKAGLNPIAVEVEPGALLRSYSAQCGREEETGLRVMLLHFGYGATSVMIAEGDSALFVKHIEMGGRQIDEAIAEQLQLGLVEANALRKRNQIDSQVSKTLQDAGRPIFEKLIRELSMCVRYHSVTFRGRPISKLIVSGGEVNERLTDLLEQRLGIPCEASDPFRRIQNAPPIECPGQWDIAMGLARRETQA
jgi:type IV pilus assembly protein PilM